MSKSVVISKCVFLYWHNWNYNWLWQCLSDYRWRQGKSSPPNRHLNRKLDILCVLCANVNSVVWLFHGKNWRLAQAVHGKGAHVVVWAELNSTPGLSGASHLCHLWLVGLFNFAGDWLPLSWRLAIFGRLVLYNYHLDYSRLWWLYAKFPRGRRTLVPVDAFLFGDLPYDCTDMDVGRVGLVGWADFNDFRITGWNFNNDASRAHCG